MGSAQASLRIEAEAARFGFFKTHGLKGGAFHKQAWEIKCANCRQEFRAYWPPSIPPEQMIKNMRIRGWDVAVGERPLCKLCAHPAANKGPVAKPEHQSFERFIKPPKKTTMFQAFSKFAEGLAVLDAPVSPSVALLARGSIVAEANGLVERATELHDKKEDVTKRLAEAQENYSRAKAVHIALRAERRAERKAARLAANPPAPVHTVYHAEAEANPKETVTMHATVTKQTVDAARAAPTPSPKITFAVYGLLESLFDKSKRMYMPGYNDARLAKEAGTTEEIVAWLRKETFGELASDPRLQGLRDDIEFMKLELVEYVKGAHVKIADLSSRLAQLEAQLVR